MHIDLIIHSFELQKYTHVHTRTYTLAVIEVTKAIYICRRARLKAHGDYPIAKVSH